jgi:hypothetical protein
VTASVSAASPASTPRRSGELPRGMTFTLVGFVSTPVGGSTRGRSA